MIQCHSDHKNDHAFVYSVVYISSFLDLFSHVFVKEKGFRGRPYTGSVPCTAAQLLPGIDRQPK